MKRAAFLLFLALICSLTASAQLTITTPGVPDSRPGMPYTPVTLTAINGIGALSWSIVGAQPPGFIVTTGGVFCYGGPASACTNNLVQTPVGQYVFRVRVSDQQSQVAFMVFTLNVSDLQVTTASLPFAVINQPYSFQLSATGGTSFFWSTDEMSSLPNWLSLSSDGILTGTPTATGKFSFIVEVFNELEQVATSQLTLTVTQGPLQVLPIPFLSPTRNVLFQTTLAATGGLPPYQWGLQGAPQGMGLNPFTGAVAWTPSTNGNFSFTAVVIDQTGTSASRQFSLIVADPPSITTTSLPNGTVNVPYPATQLSAVGGQVPYIWNVSGTLPTGLTLDPTFGTFSGTPTQVGTFSFTARVIDAGSRTGTAPLSISISSSSFSITTTSLKDAISGMSYQQPLLTTGGKTPLTWSIVTGALPVGLSIDPALGVITGKTTVTGTVNFTVQAKDSTGAVAQRAFAIVVDAQPLTVKIPPPYAIRGQATTLVTISGGRSPYTFSIASGSFPATIQSSTDTATVTATPTATGTFTFSYSVSDAGGSTIPAVPATILVVDPLLIATTTLTGTVGVPFNQNLTATGGAPILTWLPSGSVWPPGLTESASGTVTGTPTTAGTFSVLVAVNDFSPVTQGAGQTAGTRISVVINPLPSTSATIGVGNTTQPPVSVTLGASYPTDVTGTLTLSFASGFGGGDDMKKFSNGSRTVGFTIPAGSTQATFTGAPNAAVIPGTVAGTITLTASMQAAGTDITPSPAPTKTIVINPSVPVITGVSVQQVSGGINVVVTGYSSTREISSGLFHFTVSSGNTLTQSDVTVPLTSAYATWFNNATSNATGGQFKLTMPFTVSGSSTAVNSVTVTLTNQQGNSTAVASQ